MFGLTKFGLTKSRTIIYGVAGIVLTGALIPIATPAKEKWLAQVLPPTPATPATPGVPDAFTLPSQIGIPVVPPVPAFKTPTRPIRPARRVPIDPVPMPGDTRRPIPDLPKAPDIRTMPDSAATLLSGISGTVTFTPICSITAPASTCLARPYTGLIKISTAARDRVFRVSANEQGVFRVRLQPGLYVIEPAAPNFSIGTGQTVSVISSVVRQMQFNFQGIAPPVQGATLPLQGATPPAR